MTLNKGFKVFSFFIASKRLLFWNDKKYGLALIIFLFVLELSCFCRLRLTVRTLGSHPRNRGSIPLGGTNIKNRLCSLFLI